MFVSRGGNIDIFILDRFKKMWEEKSSPFLQIQSEGSKVKAAELKAHNKLVSQEKEREK